MIDQFFITSDFMIGTIPIIDSALYNNLAVK